MFPHTPTPHLQFTMAGGPMIPQSPPLPPAARNRATAARFRFRPKPPPLPHVSRTHHPANTTPSFAPPYDLPASPSAAISNGAPKIEPQWRQFGFLGPP